VARDRHGICDRYRSPWGAILAPLASGALLDHGWAPAPQLYYLFSGPFVVAAIAMLIIGRVPTALQMSANRAIGWGMQALPRIVRGAGSYVL